LPRMTGLLITRWAKRNVRGVDRPVNSRML
jgi:hypothetical protein